MTRPFYDPEALAIIARTDPRGMARAIIDRLTREDAFEPIRDLVAFTERLQIDDREVRAALSKTLFLIARRLIERDLTAESRVLWAAIRMAAVFAVDPKDLAALDEFLTPIQLGETRQVALQAIANVSQRGPQPHIPALVGLRESVLTLADRACHFTVLGIHGVAAIAIEVVVAARALGFSNDVVEGWRRQFGAHPLLMSQLDQALTDLTKGWTSPHAGGEARMCVARLASNPSDPYPVEIRFPVGLPIEECARINDALEAAVRQLGYTPHWIPLI